MEDNTDWSKLHRISGPSSGIEDFGLTLRSLFGGGEDSARAHYERAHVVFDGGEGLKGAENIAERMIEEADSCLQRS